MMQQPHLGALFVTLCLIHLSPVKGTTYNCYTCSGNAGGANACPSTFSASDPHVTAATGCSYCSATYDGTNDILICGAAGATCGTNYVTTCCTADNCNGVYISHSAAKVTCDTCTNCATTNPTGTASATHACYSCMTTVSGNSITKTCMDGVGSLQGTGPGTATTCTAVTGVTECCSNTDLCNAGTSLTTTTAAPTTAAPTAAATTAAAGATTAAAGATTAAAGATTAAAGATTASGNTSTSSTTHSSSSKTLPINAGIMIIMSLMMIAMISNLQY